MQIVEGAVPVRRTYIHRLQDENAALREDAEALRQQVQDLRTYLHSSKFQGFENAWVNPADVLHRLQGI